MKTAAARPAPWLETLRLALREFVPEDIDDLYRLDGDPRVMRFFGDGKAAPDQVTCDRLAHAAADVEHAARFRQ